VTCATLGVSVSWLYKWLRREPTDGSAAAPRWTEVTAVEMGESPDRPGDWVVSVGGCSGYAAMGEWDGAVEQVECAALVGGGLGEFVDLDGGVVVANPVAGEGGQVVEQVMEAADRVAVGVVLGGGFLFGAGRAVRGRDRVVPGPGLLT
jgi:hypothetical protein